MSNEKNQPEKELVPFEVGGYYRTQGGKWVQFMEVHRQGTSYETMLGDDGIHRYTNRPYCDMGRVTGSCHDYTDPRNTPALYSATHLPMKEIVEQLQSDKPFSIGQVPRGWDVVRKNDETITILCPNDSQIDFFSGSSDNRVYYFLDSTLLLRNKGK